MSLEFSFLILWICPLNGMFVTFMRSILLLSLILFISAIYQILWFSIQIFIYNMTIPNTLYLKYHVYFSSEFLNLRYQRKMISFGNCVILYLFSLFLVRAEHTGWKGYTTFGNSNFGARKSYFPVDVAKNKAGIPLIRNPRGYIYI